MGFHQHHLNSAEESRAEAERYQEQVKAAGAQQANKLEALRGYFALQQAFRADVPVVLPSECTPLFGLESQTTEKRTTVTRAWAKEQLARLKLSKLPTQPLRQEDLPVHLQDTKPLPLVQQVQEIWYSLKPEILEKVPTQPLDQDQHTVKPRITLKEKRGA